MPYRRKYKKKIFRKRSGFRKRTRTFRKKRVPRRIPYGIVAGGSGPMGSGFPQRLRFKFYYTYSALHTSTSPASLLLTTTRMNSIFDPEEATGGGQPAFRDDLANVYNFYQVNAAKITYEIVPIPLIGTTAGPNPFNCYLTIGRDPTYPEAGTSETELQAIPNTRVVSFQGYSATYAPRKRIVSQFVRIQNLNKGYGPNSASADDKWSSLITTNPSTQVYATIGTVQEARSDLGTGSGSDFRVRIRIKICYYTTLYRTSRPGFGMD